jgi:predicted transcriptional regulator
MSRRASDRPTDGELAILKILWDRGPCTVREVHGLLPGEVGYTTVLKLLQIMTDKGLVLRDESQRAHVYTPARGREETEGNLIRDLASRAFDGSASRLVIRALASEQASPEEIAEIRRLLDALEREDGR